MTGRPSRQHRIGQAYPSGFEEDDRLRSNFIRDLSLQQFSRGDTTTGDRRADLTATIPKTLVRFWHNSSQVPPDVRKCLDSWDALRAEGFELLTFDDVSASRYISDRYGPREVTAFKRCRHPAMRSDYLRLCAVLADGGLYVDADDVLLGRGWQHIFRDSTLKLQALCYNLGAGGMAPADDLLRVDLPYDDRIFYVNNNPIAAPSGHPVLARALARATTRLLGSNPTPEIQETTGPGNITAALALHARELQVSGLAPDFELLFEWDRTAEPCWDLAYRRDARNWRNMGDR